MLDTVVISGEDVCCSMVFGTLVDVCELCMYMAGQVSVYCARRIPAHRWYTQCSILFHLIDICFLPCICMGQISQIQACLRVVVGPGLVSTSPAFMRSSASHPAGPLYRLAKDGKSDPH